MWLYKGKEYTEKPSTDVEGFIYLITNTENGKSYIGQKNYGERIKTY